MLAGPSPERRELLALRVERWWEDLRDGSAGAHRSDQLPDLEARLLRAATTAVAEREPDLHRLDQARTLAPDRFQRPDVLGCAASTERSAGTLAEVVDQVPYPEELGVDTPTGRALGLGGDGDLWLPPHGAAWTSAG